MYKKILIILLISLFKIFIWVTFKDQTVNFLNIIFEKLNFVSKGKQDFFDGISKVIILAKTSIIAVDITIDIIIIVLIQLLFKRFILKQFTYRYMIINFFLLIFILLFI